MKAPHREPPADRLRPGGAVVGSLSTSEPGDAVCDERPVLVVYFVFHPRADAGEDLARAVFTALCSDPEHPASRGVGVPVRYRTTANVDEVPAELAFGIAQHTAVFVLAEDELCASPQWQAYADHVAESKGPGDLVVPVALTSTDHLPPTLATLQAIRLADVPSHQRSTALMRDITHDLCRILDPNAAKVKVFLSHAKRDGAVIAQSVRRHLREEDRLDDFFDEADIPDGTGFARFLQESAGSAHALLAIQTDSYASREWCRLEVLEAKRMGVPIVVLAAMERGEQRAFPYMGNVPVLCWRGDESLAAVAGALLQEVLRKRYFPMRVDALCRLLGQKDQRTVLTSAPELFTVLHQRAGKGPGKTTGTLVYPDPPLGTEEAEVLRLLNPTVSVATPTMLMAR